MAGVLVLGVALGFTTVVGRAAVRYEEVVREPSFLMDVLLDAVTIPNHRGFDDLLLLGRNYESREARLYRIRWSGDAFTVLWRSDNLFEWSSALALAHGDFRGLGHVEVVVVTRSTLRLFAPTRDEMAEVWSGPSPLGAVWEAIGLRTARDEPYRLGLTRVYEVKDSVPHKEIVWYAWSGRGWRPRSDRLLVGPVRSLAAAHLTGRDVQELVAERGTGTGSGRLDVWQPRSDGFVRIASQVVRPAAIFALGSPPSASPLRAWLAAGDNRGRVGLYSWGQDGSLRAWGEPAPVGWGLTGVAVGDVTGNGRPDIAVLGYPARLHLLVPAEAGN